MKIPGLTGGKRRIAIAGIALASFIGIASVTFYTATDRANAAASTAEVAEGPDALAGLEGRSPGARLVGIATKAVKAVSRALGGTPPAEEPTQRALGQIFDPPIVVPRGVGVPDPTAALLPADPFIPADPTVFAGSSGGVPTVTPPGGFIYVPGGSSGGTTGGSTGGGTTGGGTTGGGSSGGDNPPPVAAVPEPGTWLMMILGFGAVGAAMRGQSRKKRPLAKA